jgi:Ca2+-binding EF-hand superfamily protein
MEVYQGVCGFIISRTRLGVLTKGAQDWQGVFLHFDRDRSGTIDGQELQQALNQFGFRLTPHLLSLLERKYGAVHF